jgi:ligand-binding sensor domain-containing protein
MNLNLTTSRIFAIVSLILILISTNFLFSQTIEWIVYNENGKYISCIADEIENLWVGTLGGGLVKLNKLTGNFVAYGEWNSGLPDNNVWAIVIDGQGNKWIGTGGGGLAKFDGVNWTVYKTSNSGLPSDTVTAIAIDGQGNKWIGTWGGGLAKFDGVSWKVYNFRNSGLPSDSVLAIAIDGQGTNGLELMLVCEV